MDDKAIFSKNAIARRSDLFQYIQGNDKGTTYYRASLMKKDPFVNRYDWRLVFMDSGMFEIGVDATTEPHVIYFRNNGTLDFRWDTGFTPGAWYNFLVAVGKSADGKKTVMEFHTSLGKDDPVFNFEDVLFGTFQPRDALHVGLMTENTDGKEIIMKDKKESVAFSGVSAEATASDAGIPTPGSPASTGASETRSPYNFNNRK